MTLRALTQAELDTVLRQIRSNFLHGIPAESVNIGRIYMGNVGAITLAGDPAIILAIMAGFEDFLNANKKHERKLNEVHDKVREDHDDRAN